MATIYSFKDLSGAIAGSTIGAFIFSGGEQLGTGSIAISMITDKTAHDIAADGGVMISKIAGDNGTISIECQQNSDLDAFLLAAYNATLIADSSVWAEMAATLRSTVMRRSHVATDISFQKVPDRTYASQGGRVTWQLMSANIMQLPI